MRILVTGGSGFIGQHVTHRLHELGHEPFIFDRHRHAANIYDTFLGDTRDATAVSEAVALSDGVIHLAGVLGTQETIKNPRPAVESNVYGSLNVFDACAAYDRPCSYITVGNYWFLNTYSNTKTAAEVFAWMYNREHGTRIAVVRALNAYGPGQKAEPVRKIIPNFILPALADGELLVYGDGMQIMDMIYVADVADVMVRALLEDHRQYVYNPLRNEDAPTKFEAGTGRPTTVLEIAELVIRLVGKGRVRHLPMRPGEPEHSVVLGDPETLRPLYNGHPPDLLSLEEGLERTIDYYSKGSQPRRVKEETNARMDTG